MAILKLRFRNYNSETIAIQKLYRDYQDFAQGSDDIKIPTPMELQIDLDCPQGSDDIKIPTPVELHIDLHCPQGEDDIKIPSLVELHIDLDCPQG